jgi:hypothetical protein
MLDSHGVLRIQPFNAWRGDFPLPSVLKSFYRDVGPVNLVVHWHGNPFFLPALASLWEHQQGYRWSSVTRERIVDWDDDWLVVADQGGDPFIFSRHSGRILFALHGGGSWKPEPVFPDVYSMAACMAVLGSIRKRAGDAFTDEDSNVRPKYLRAARKEIAEVLSGYDAVNHTLTLLELE